MRKSIVLALALVLALAGSSFAATLSWSGEFNAKADWKPDLGKPEAEKFFGGYELTKALKLNFALAQDKGAWDASFALSALSPDKLGKYTVNVNEDAFKLTAWGNYNWDVLRETLGDKGDALGLLVIDGKNQAPEPKFRLTTDLGGFSITSQVEKAGLLAFNAETDLSGFTLGATVDIDSTNTTRRFGVYGGTDFGILSIDAAFASTDEKDDENSAYGVEVGSEITDAFSVGGYYVVAGAHYGGVDSEYGVEGVYEEGLLKATVNYDYDIKEETSATSIGATYRGSENNVAFAALFHPAHYFKNEAFAFAGKYTINDADDVAASTIALDATGPIIPGQFWLKGNLTLQQNADGFKSTTGIALLSAGKDAWNDENGGWKVDEETVTARTALTLNGYAPMGKLVFKPELATTQWTDVKATLGAYDEDDNATNTEENLTGNVSKFVAKLVVDYNVADDATISAYIGQESYSGTGDFADAKVKRESGLSLTVKF